MSTSFVGVEVLEDRRLLSTTLAPHAKPAPFPNVVGHYAGTAVFTSGLTDTLQLTVAKQRSGAFSGTTIQGAGPTGKIVGTITRKGVVHATLRGTNIHFTSTLKGTFSGGVLSLSFKTIQQVLHLTGTVRLQEFSTIQ